MLGIFGTLVRVPFIARRLARLFQFCKKNIIVSLSVHNYETSEHFAEFQGFMERKVSGAEIRIII
jgi:hypothetical protein